MPGRAPCNNVRGTSFEQKFVKRNLSESIPLCRAYWGTRRKRVPFRDFHISLPPSFFLSSFILACSGSRRHSSPKLSLSLTHFSTGGSRDATGGNYRSSSGARCRFALATVSLTFIIPWHMGSSVFSEYESTYPAPSGACGPSSHGFVSADPHLDRAPFSSGLVTSLAPFSTRNRPDPFRSVPFRPVPTRRLVSPRLASLRLASPRLARTAGAVVRSR